MTDREYICSKVKELSDEYTTRLRDILEDMLETDAKTEFVEVADIEEVGNGRWCVNCYYSDLEGGCPKRCTFGVVDGIWVEKGKGVL